MNSALPERILALGICTALLSACATTIKPGVFRPEATDENLSSIYIYRPDTISNTLYTPALDIDGTAHGDIRSGHIYMYQLAPGQHQFQLSINNDNFVTLPVELNTDAGSRYFFRVDSRLQLDTQHTGYAPYRRSFSLLQVNQERAATEIADCCQVTKQDTSLNSSAQRESSSGQGFSSDLTQNPFGH
jgi:hypothetical protein